MGIRGRSSLGKGTGALLLFSAGQLTHDPDTGSMEQDGACLLRVLLPGTPNCVIEVYC